MAGYIAPTADNTHLSSNFGKLLEPGLRKVFFETYDEIPEQFSKVFHIKTSKNAKETDYGVGAFNVWAKRTSGIDPVTYGTLPPGLERTYIHEEFTGGFMVERKYVDDEMYGVINKMPAALARDGRAKIEEDVVGLFNDAFTTLQYDNKSLFAADHPLLGGGTGSNLVTGALGETTIKEAITTMRATPDEAGRIIGLHPDVLVIDPSNEFLAMEILQSKLRSGTPNNDINSLLGRLRIFVWDFLDEGKWFIMDSKRHEANFFWRVKPEFKRTEDFDTLVAKYRGYMRYSFGVSDWRGLVGSTGLAG